ncbi:MAG TPA: DUF4347 domain-containing protein, partial [Nitrospirota bacterium]|nr:DUF4347 domain-containing protein [Nitrospirota bacterium]
MLDTEFSPYQDLAQAPIAAEVAFLEDANQPGLLDLSGSADLHPLLLADPMDGVGMRELVFFDEKLPQHQQLIADLQKNGCDRNLEVVELESDRNGIEQVSEILSKRSDLAAVHFISHGTDGQINLGNACLNSNALQQNADAISTWGKALTETGDILFYGCNIAAGRDGQGLLKAIADLTGADVAASTDLTGHRSLGGDWELEHRVGLIGVEVAVSVAVQEQWLGILPTYTEFTNSTAALEIKSDANHGQTFTHTSGAGTYTVNQISLMLHRESDVSPQTITVQLRDSWDGTVLGTATIASGSLSTSQAWYDLSIGDVTLNDGQSYTIRVSSDTTAGKVHLGFNSSGGYSAGTRIETDGSALPGEDVAFKVGFSTSSIVGTVFHDVDGDADVSEAGTLVFNGATVRLWRDNGDAAPGSTDTLLRTTTTDASGHYSFTGLLDGTYWVTVDSKTLGASGYKSGYAADDVWAEQTYGVTGSASGAGEIPCAGALFG